MACKNINRRIFTIRFLFAFKGYSCEYNQYIFLGNYYYPEKTKPLKNGLIVLLT